MSTTRDDVLRLTVTGKNNGVAADSLASIVLEMTHILQELDAQISKKNSGTLDWMITHIQMSSPLSMYIKPEKHRKERYYGGRVIAAYMKGLAAIENKAESPAHFSDRALASAKKMVAVLKNGVNDLTFQYNQHPSVSPSLRVAAHVDTIIATRPDQFFQRTSLEGVLDLISIRGEPIAQMAVTRTKERVVCKMSKAQIEKTLSVFGHRVTIHGRVKYTKEGKPEEIEVGQIRRLSKDRPPSFGDLEGINITGGIDPTEYVRRLRDAN
jgi:hypothetical protein